MRAVVLSLNIANALCLQRYMYASTRAFIHPFILSAFIGHLLYSELELLFAFFHLKLQLH